MKPWLHFGCHGTDLSLPLANETARIGRTMRAKISLRAIAALPPNSIIWDTEIRGLNVRTDIIISKDDGIKHHFELKNWKGKYGDDQLDSMRRDVGRLQPRENGYFLVTSCNPLGQTEENIKYLFDRVDGLEDSSKKVFQLRTVDHKGSDFEFWIAGWSVSKSPIEGKSLA
jgi:hypothetical protein